LVKVVLVHILGGLDLPTSPPQKNVILKYPGKMSLMLRFFQVYEKANCYVLHPNDQLEDEIKVASRAECIVE